MAGARLALEHDDHDVAAVWAERSLAARDSTAARWVYGVARAELGLFNLDRGNRAGRLLVAEGMLALEAAAAALDTEAPPEDALAIHALRAYLFARFGLAERADEALARAASLADAPGARTGDLLHLARALMHRGRHAHAEEILRAALEKAKDREQRREGRLWLGECALVLGRPAEAEALSREVLAELPQPADDRDAERRIEAEWLHAGALLARDATSEVLAFVDEAMRASKPWWDWSGPAASGVPHQAVWRMPLLVRVLRRAGRFQDAEILLRSILGLPVASDAVSFGAGLKSQDLLQAFVRRTEGPVQMAPGLRSSLLSELVLVLRAEGRHAEAEELSRGIGRAVEP